MKRALVLSVAVVLLLLVGLITAVNYNFTSNTKKEPFHVGVTYCGDSVADAKQLIDTVKDYTNLFVVQSSFLQNNFTLLEEVCDYAVNANLNVITYFSTHFSSSPSENASSFVKTAQTRWGSHFLGVYFSDEPGGRMLDFGLPLYNASDGQYITKQTGYYKVTKNTDTHFVAIMFYNSGRIVLSVSPKDPPNYFNFTTYYPNGTIMCHTSDGGYQIFYQPDGTITDFYGTPVTGVGNISQFEPYSPLWDSRPIKTYADAAKLYVDTVKNLQASLRNQTSINLFTSDYGLYWWDYQGGYDVVLGELGWNHTTTQDIALVRGAANLQNKSWGTIITWKYTQEPYLASGQEIYDQMRASYECGAKYIVIFNYAENMTGPYGTLQPEHFQALGRFWNEVVLNPDVVHGGVKAEAALVLPEDYGWGMRKPDDTIWGLWSADSTSEQIWTQLQSKLEQYGSKLDIVYDDPAYPVAGKYNQIHYWNQTS